MRRAEYERRRGVTGVTRRGRWRRAVAAIAAVAAGGVAVLVPLLAGSGLLPVWQSLWPVRVATWRSTPGAAVAPPPRPAGTRRGAPGVALAESSKTWEVAAIGSERPGRPLPAAETEATPEQSARPRTRLPEATPGPSEQAEPRPTAASPSPEVEPDAREVTAHIETEPLGGGVTGYTVRLHEHDGRPVTGATVSIRGRRADGALDEASLQPEAEPGLYRAVVRLAFTEARLRVASVGRVQEIPLPDSPS
jgi:hypothetical protein